MNPATMMINPVANLYGTGILPNNINNPTITKIIGMKKSRKKLIIVIPTKKMIANTMIETNINAIICGELIKLAITPLLSLFNFINNLLARLQRFE
jgi:predicted membrane protein